MGLIQAPTGKPAGGQRHLRRQVELTFSVTTATVNVSASSARPRRLRSTATSPLASDIGTAAPHIICGDAIARHSRGHRRRRGHRALGAALDMPIQVAGNINRHLDRPRHRRHQRDQSTSPPAPRRRCPLNGTTVADPRADQRVRRRRRRPGPAPSGCPGLPGDDVDHRVGHWPLGLPLGTGILNSTVNSVTATTLSQIVNPLITELDALLLGPLTDLLGLNVAGADVAAVSIDCTSPVLLI